MRDAVAGWWAMGLLTLRELQRQRLWVLVLGLAALVLIAVPSLRAVDDEARLKLAVATVVGASGFIVVLLAALVGASALRRDIDSKTGYLLFAKPMPRGAYLLGRWSGVVVALLACVLVLGAVGSLAIWLRLGELPQPRRVAAATAITGISLDTETPLPATSSALRLAGDPNRGQAEAVRWDFTDIPTGADGELELLLRIGVSGSSLGLPVREARVTVTARDPDGRSVVLPLAADSPYGEALGEQRSGVVALRGRGPARDDLTQDYARFRIPPELVQDGRLALRLNRLDAGAAVLIDRESAFVATGQGGFAGNLGRAQLVSLAQAALLCAATLAMVTVARIGTALLGALTITFAGSGLAFVSAGFRAGELPLAVERLLVLLRVALPDFSRYNVEAAVAASRQVAWGTVGEAWLYFGAYTLAFLILAWLGLRKVDL